MNTLIDILNPLDGETPLRDAFGPIGDTVINAIDPTDGETPLRDGLDNLFGGGIGGGGLLGGLFGGGGGGEGSTPGQTCKPMTCWDKCKAETKKKEDACKKKNEEHLKAMKAMGCNGVTCKMPPFPTCGKKTTPVKKVCAVKKYTSNSCGCRIKE